jgi:hypothetical protein
VILDALARLHIGERVTVSHIPRNEGAADQQLRTIKEAEGSADRNDCLSHTQLLLQ